MTVSNYTLPTFKEWFLGARATPEYTLVTKAIDDIELEFKHLPEKRREACMARVREKADTILQDLSRLSKTGTQNATLQSIAKQRIPELRKEASACFDAHERIAKANSAIDRQISALDVPKSYSFPLRGELERCLRKDSRLATVPNRDYLIEKVAVTCANSEKTLSGIDTAVFHVFEDSRFLRRLPDDACQRTHTLFVEALQACKVTDPVPPDDALFLQILSDELSDL